MDKIFEHISRMKIIPVIVIEDAKDAVSLAQALCAGGLPCGEVTFRTEAAVEGIKKIHEKFPGMLIGAGTVLTKTKVDQAMEAGAQFIVSPGFDSEVVDYCISRNIPVIPGCMTPTEITMAVKAGLSVVKFFPAQPAGGITMLKALAAPYPKLKFMPTGGIDPQNLKDYLSFSKVIACGGSWMVKENLIKAGDFDKIYELTKNAVALAQEGSMTDASSKI